MSANADSPQDHNPQADIATLEKARREKLRRWRDELGLEPYGSRVDGLVALAEARATLDEGAHERYAESAAAAKEDSSVQIIDDRPRAKVAGRCVQHRAMGKLVFVRLRDHSGDLQISISKSDVEAQMFTLA